MTIKKYELSIFIFRRDLRLQDNIGLIEALKNSAHVLPIFIFTPEQLVNNPYKSEHCVKFMIESLEELDSSLRKHKSKLFYFYGHPDKIVQKLLANKSLDVNAVFINKDYTPYSLKRDKSINKVCSHYGVQLEEYEDILLLPIGTVKNGQNETYTKFTPFYNTASKIKIKPVIQNKMNNYYSNRHAISGEFNGDIHKFYKNDSNNIKKDKSGRGEALAILHNVNSFKSYNKDRDDLSYDTTHLSAHLKFGNVSIREVYHIFKSKLGTKNQLIKQLYWRDFYYNIAYSFPHVFSTSGNLKEKYNKIHWNNNRNLFNKWKNGQTGFPIVDAAMREMNTTGFMHNRARLIVASFLVKILLINWKWGEKYFAQTLIDYDPSVNNGNWQWVAGSGADAQPYFRIFNPWEQAKNHDSECIYIKKWIPELKNISNKHILQWDKYHIEHKDVKYPKPIIDYNNQKEKALNAYKKIF